MHTTPPEGDAKPLTPTLALLSSERPRNVGTLSAAGLLFGDWGTSRLYVLGFAFLVAGRSSFWLVCMMSVLILAVGWAYTQICRIYSDGGGVYTAARHFHPVLGVIGALLLFSDYTITASLSALEAFKYFGLSAQTEHVVTTGSIDPGDDIQLHSERKAAEPAMTFSESMGKWWQDMKLGLAPTAPGFWAIVAIFLIGGVNLLGPKHSAGPALIAAGAMVLITLLVVVCAFPQINFSELKLGTLNHPPLELWQAFVAVVLALSGVEAIANLTGVMKRPVYKTASKAIWLCAIEVALFNILLAIVMCSITMNREEHVGDMLAHMAKSYIGPWGEWLVRGVAGLLLLSATNTAIGALMGTVYVMSRDGELPAFLQKLNGFGAPWIGAVIAALVPSIVLVFFHDVEQLGHLYAIGIVGAVAINCTLCAFHPRLRAWWRKTPMLLLGLFLVAIWITLALTKLHALIFVCVVMAVGLSLRQATRWAAKRKPKPSLLRQAIMEQLTPAALARPKMLLATAGSDQMAIPAMELAKTEHAALVVCFIRELALSYKVESQESRMTLDTDAAAQELFTNFLEHGHRNDVPIIPMYDTGNNSAELLAEFAALNGVHKVLIGSSRRGAFHKLVKGSFQKKIESLLPPEIQVQVITAPG